MNGEIIGKIIYTLSLGGVNMIDYSKEKIKRISDILKREFPNLTVSKTIDMAFDIIHACRDEAEFTYVDREIGSLRLTGGQVDVDNLNRLIIKIGTK